MFVHLWEHVCFPMEVAELAPIWAGLVAFSTFPSMVMAVDYTYSTLIAPLPGGAPGLP